mmetsp:Transcript_5474/g.15195  ORF Transcript_5474/g.15195 Transcript_5474/m.15195 type:complete len:206 (+) Transcript_5474:239-856(+)
MSAWKGGHTQRILAHYANSGSSGWPLTHRTGSVHRLIALNDATRRAKRTTMTSRTFRCVNCARKSAARVPCCSVMECTGLAMQHTTTRVLVSLQCLVVLGSVPTAWSVGSTWTHEGGGAGRESQLQLHRSLVMVHRPQHLGEGKSGSSSRSCFGSGSPNRGRSPGKNRGRNCRGPPLLSRRRTSPASTKGFDEIAMVQMCRPTFD